jgi:hypothetical protein
MYKQSFNDENSSYVKDLRLWTPYIYGRWPISLTSDDYGTFTFCRRIGRMQLRGAAGRSPMGGQRQSHLYSAHFGTKSLIVDRLRHSIDMPRANGAA